MTVVPSPYEFTAPITDPDLLDLRRDEIEDALNTVAAASTEPVGHAVILGERHSGRTSVLLEVARRAAAERQWLVVRLRPTAAQLAGPHAFVRHLLIAAVDEVARSTRTRDAAWHRAWRTRVLLRATAPATDEDLLDSSLALAADPEAMIDPASLAHDLRQLRLLAETNGAHGLLFCLDDASELTEDAATVEHLLDCFDAAGRCSLLLAALPTTVRHFKEAVSPCLVRFNPCPLSRFQVRDVITCLRSTVDGQERMGLRG